MYTTLKYDDEYLYKSRREDTVISRALARGPDRLLLRFFRCFLILLAQQNS